MGILGLFRFLFFVMLGAILVIALLPNSMAVALFASDKLNHLLAFFVLSFSSRVLWPRTNAILVFGLLAMYGGSIEIFQWALGFGRDADWLDFAADVLALFAGFAFAYCLNAIWYRIGATAT